MFIAKATHWWSWNYKVMDGHNEITALTVGTVRDRGTFSVNGKQYQVIKEGFLNPSFFLKEGEKTVFEVSRSGAFRQSFTWTLNGMPYTLRNAAWYSNNFNLFRSETCVGSIRRKHWYSSEAIVDLPEDLPIESQIFLLWLAVLQWKKQASSSSP